MFTGRHELQQISRQPEEETLINSSDQQVGDLLEHVEPDSTKLNSLHCVADLKNFRKDFE